MYIDAATILQWTAVISAIAGLGAMLYKSFKWMNRQSQQDEEIKNLRKEHADDVKAMKEEQCLICYGLLGALDGLKQLGANGNVTDAYQKMEKHLNKAAHE